MKPKLYLETSIVSYLSARPSNDLIVSANQLMVHEWWDTRRQNFDLFVSELVAYECGRGDATMAQMRLDLIKDFPILDIDEQVIDLADEITRRNVLPAKAAADISHIAISAVHEIDFLLTLNCKHIANAFTFRRIEQICRAMGYEPPLVCTPQEILGKENEIDER